MNEYGYTDPTTGTELRNAPKSTLQKLIDKALGVAKGTEDVAVGTGETALAGATGMLAWPLAKIGAAFYAPTQFYNPKWGERTQEVENAIARMFTYQPKSASGQASANAIGTAMSLPFRPAEWVGEKLSTWDPNLGYVAKTGAEYGTLAATPYATKGTKVILTDPTIANQRGYVGGPKATSWYERIGEKGEYSSLVDRKPRFRVSDAGAKVINVAKLPKPDPATPFPEYYLPQIYQHPELYKDYPELRNVKVELYPRPGANPEGWLEPETKKLSVTYDQMGNPDRNVIEHEVHHWISNKEGRPGGANESMFVDEYNADLEKISDKFDPRIEELTDRADELQQTQRQMMARGEHRSNPYSWLNLLAEQRDVWEKWSSLIDDKFNEVAKLKSTYDRYWSVSDEVEARAVMKQNYLPQEYLSGVDPYYPERYGVDEMRIMDQKGNVVRSGPTSWDTLKQVQGINEWYSQKHGQIMERYDAAKQRWQESGYEDEAAHAEMRKAANDRRELLNWTNKKVEEAKRGLGAAWLGKVMGTNYDDKRN